MLKDSPCAICSSSHECRDRCPVIKKWAENKRLSEKFLDIDLPFELLGIETEDIIFH